MQEQKECDINEKLEYLEKYLLMQENYSEEQIKAFKHTFSYTKAELKRRWLSANRKDNLFRKNNEIWLQGTLELPKAMTTATTVFGRPQKSFGDSSERSKRRKTQGLRETVDTEELTFATQMKLRACGKPDASKVLKEITKSPKRATKYRKAYSSSLQEKRGQLSPLQALSMFVEAGNLLYHLLFMSYCSLIICSISIVVVVVVVVKSTVQTQV